MKNELPTLARIVLASVIAKHGFIGLSKGKDVTYQTGFDRWRRTIWGPLNGIKRNAGGH
jgi:hypothetical protein